MHIKTQVDNLYVVVALDDVVVAAVKMASFAMQQHAAVAAAASF